MCVLCVSELGPLHRTRAPKTHILVRQGDTSSPFLLQALMMAASADSPATIALLLKKNAQINMKVRIHRWLAYWHTQHTLQVSPCNLCRVILVNSSI